MKEPFPRPLLLRGTTLLEVTIVSLILTVILGTVVMLLLSTSQFYEVASIDTDMFQRGQIAMVELTEELEKVFRDKMEITDGGTKLTYTPVLGWDTKHHQPQYYTAQRTFWWETKDGTLMYREGTGDPRIVCHDVVKFELSTQDEKAPNKLVVTLQMAKKIYAGKVEWKTQHMRREIYIRKQPDLP